MDDTYCIRSTFIVEPNFTQKCKNFSLVAVEIDAWFRCRAAQIKITVPLQKDGISQCRYLGLILDGVDFQPVHRLLA